MKMAKRLCFLSIRLLAVKGETVPSLGDSLRIGSLAAFEIFSPAAGRTWPSGSILSYRRLNEGVRNHAREEALASPTTWASAPAGLPDAKPHLHPVGIGQ